MYHLKIILLINLLILHVINHLILIKLPGIQDYPQVYLQ
jgi:hypothetical protein